MIDALVPEPLHVTAYAPLVTERLTVRLTGSEDADAFVAMLSQPEVCRYLLHHPLDRAGVEARFARTAGRDTLRADGDVLRFTVVRRADAVVLGELVLIARSIASATLEIGWVLHPDHQGHGYAAEAARALLEWGFGTLDAHRVVAQLHPDNTASATLCERLGMRREAHHRRDIWLKGHWEDTVIYAVLAEDRRR